MTTSREYHQYLFSGKWDQRLAEMYGDELVEFSRERYLNILKKAENVFADEEVLLVCGCGRAELGGNHTDHNHGNVLAVAVHLDNIAVVKKRDDMRVKVSSAGFEPIELALDNLEPVDQEKNTPQAIIRGVAAGILKREGAVCGFDGIIDNMIPIGSGLSSSAAFEVLVCNIINYLQTGTGGDAIQTALIAKEAENIHFGKPCGLMDQLACSYGGIMQIDFLDPAQPVISPIDFDFEQFGYQLAIVKTGGDHVNLTEEYAAIPHEMTGAARMLGKDWGRQVSMDELLAGSQKIRNELGDRAFLRLFHFIHENQRAVKQADALRNNDMGLFLSLVRESADSSYRFLQNCTSVLDIHHQPIPVALAVSEQLLGEKGASRVHGGGFAGTIQVFVPTDDFGNYQKRMNELFGEDAVVPLHIRQPGFEFFEM